MRQIARQSIRAGQILRETGARAQYRDWIELRAELAYALRVWSTYRDWIARHGGPMA